MEPVIVQGPLDDAVMTHPPVPFSTARRHPDLVFGDPQGEEVAATRTGTFQLFPMAVPSCFHDLSSYRGLSPDLERVSRYKADGIFDMLGAHKPFAADAKSRAAEKQPSDMADEVHRREASRFGFIAYTAGKERNHERQKSGRGDGCTYP
jgi:hypothetical protein